MAHYKPGDVIFTERPFVHVLHAEEKKHYCDNCIKPSLTLKGCGACNYMFYCNRECQREDWKLHKHECPIYKKLEIGGQFLSLRNSRINLRTFFLLKHHPEKRHERFPVPGSDRTRCYQDLITHEDDIKSSDFLNFGFLFMISNVEIDNGEMEQIYYKNRMNSTCLQPHFGTTPATGVYIGLSSLDHSCQPNASMISRGTTITLLARRDIQPGEQITVAYHDLLVNTDTRRKTLSENFFFICKCNRCTSRVDDDVNYARLKAQLQRLSTFTLRKQFDEFIRLYNQIKPVLIRVLGKYSPHMTYMHHMAFHFFHQSGMKMNDTMRRIIADYQDCLRVTDGPENENKSIRDLDEYIHTKEALTMREIEHKHGYHANCHH